MRRWREIATEMGVSFIDHLEAYAARPNPEDKVYLATDTHWNTLSWQLALRQLKQAYTGLIVPQPRTLPPADKGITRDLMIMLRLEDTEATPEIDWNWYETHMAHSGTFDADTLILGDSFYEQIPKLLPSVFAHFRQAHIVYDDLAAAVASHPEAILINSVERDFFRRVTEGELSWKLPFGPAMLDLSNSPDCPESLLPSERMQMFNLSGPPEALTAAVDPQIYVDIPPAEEGEIVCLEVSFDTASDEIAKIFLPLPDRPDHYSEGYAVEFPASDTGTRHLALSFPRAMLGDRIRIDPIVSEGTIANLQVRLGARP